LNLLCLDLPSLQFQRLLDSSLLQPPWALATAVFHLLFAPKPSLPPFSTHLCSNLLPKFSPLFTTHLCSDLLLLHSHHHPQQLFGHCYCFKLIQFFVL
jgi:hypothetical protein